MIHSVEESKKIFDIIKTVQQAQEDDMRPYRKGTCEFCKSELVIPQEKLNDEFFGHPEVAEDEYFYKCPVCGHVNVGKNEDLGICYQNGRTNRVYELTDKETEAAIAFEHEHMQKHKELFYTNDGKLRFSAHDKSFTYTITPSLLAHSVIITCNECGESKDITDK